MYLLDLDTLYAMYNGFICTENDVTTNIHMCWEYDAVGWVGDFKVTVTGSVF